MPFCWAARRTSSMEFVLRRARVQQFEVGADLTGLHAGEVDDIADQGAQVRQTQRRALEQAAGLLIDRAAVAAQDELQVAFHGRHRALDLVGNHREEVGEHGGRAFHPPPDDRGDAIEDLVADVRLIQHHLEQALARHHQNGGLVLATAGRGVLVGAHQTRPADRLPGSHDLDRGAPGRPGAS